MTNALALQHNEKEEKIHDMYKTYTIANVKWKKTKWPKMKRKTICKDENSDIGLFSSMLTSFCSQHATIF